MDPSIIGLLGFAVTLALILLRVPVAVAMGMVGIVGFGILNQWYGVGFVVGSAPYEAVSTYTLSVVPLFILMGVFAAHAGLSRSLYHAVNAFIGHRRGGLAMATIGACAGFGAISGSSLATAATMAQVAMPEMRARGYDDRLASASIAAGGTLGVMIPPSVLLVIYAFLSGESVGRLFAAALIPGILGMLLYMGAVVVQTRRNPALGPGGERLGWRARLRALRDVWQVVLLFVVVIGGIYVGLFSPTQAAAVGAFGAILMTWLSGNLTRPVLAISIKETAGTVGMIFLILVGAGLFNYFIESTALPQFLIGATEALDWPPLAVLVLVLVFYIVLGCLMDSLSMILLTTPFILPLVEAQGFDPLWFGIVVVTVAELGLITPPVGINLFIIQGVARDLRLQTIVRGIVPFILADLVRIALLVALPGLALWLPTVIFG